MKFKLTPPQQKYFRDGQWIAPAEHDGHGVFERPDSELPEIIRVFPGVKVLSDEAHWFRMTEGKAALSIEQRHFAADERGYFQAPVNLAPAILYLSGFTYVGRQRPSARSAPAREKRRPSRERPYWSQARKIAFEWLRDNGAPAPGDGNQSQLEKHVADWLGGRGQHPAESTIREHVRPWIAEYRENPSIA